MEGQLGAVEAESEGVKKVKTGEEEGDKMEE
jgi:hypothetical protein